MFIKRFYVKLLDDYFKQAVFAKPMGPTDEVGPGLSNFHLWWKRIQKALDPDGVSPEGGALVKFLAYGGEVDTRQIIVC